MFFSISFSDSFKESPPRKRTSSSGLGCFQALYNHSRAIPGKDYANSPEFPNAEGIDFSYSPNDSFFRRFFRSSTFVSALVPFSFHSLSVPFFRSPLRDVQTRTLEISGVSRTGKSRFRTPNSAELNPSFDAEFVLIATAVRHE